ncbi:MAG: ABC transporter permease subunit [Candidatus Thermoplasmatota archaeon]
MSQRLLGSVFQRTLRDQQRALFGFGLGLVIYVSFIAAFYPTVRAQREQFDQLIAAYPPALRAAFGITDLGSAAGFLSAELFSAMLPLVFLIYAIGRAADVVAGEEERGALDVLLTHPVSRRRALAGKAGGLAVGLAALAVLLWAALAVGGFVVGMGLDLLRVAEVVLLLLLLSYAFGSIALLLACFRGRKGSAVGASSAIAVASYLLYSFGSIVDALATVRKASPFYYYAASPPLTATFEPAHAAVLAALTLVATVLAFWAFERRDIGVG